MLTAGGCRSATAGGSKENLFHHHEHLDSAQKLSQKIDTDVGSVPGVWNSPKKVRKIYPSKPIGWVARPEVVCCPGKGLLCDRDVECGVGSKVIA